MTENLNVTTFRNVDPILHAVTQEEWIKAGKRGEPAQCYYNNNSEKEKKYGKLYNWYAVNDIRGIAPYGWHEWSVLIDCLGGEEVAGKKMKSSEGWTVKMNGANSSGFTALPGGFRSDLGRYGGIGNSSYWWSSSEDEFIINTVRIRFLFSNEVGVNSINSEMNSGRYIRCLRN